jgi:hypothetical protein
MDREELRQMLRARREKLAIGGAEIATDLQWLRAKGALDVLAAAIMRRVVLAVEAEVRWHDELDALLAGEPADEERPGTPSAEAATDRAPRRETA